MSSHTTALGTSSSHTSEHGTLPVAPIERTWNPFLALVFLAMRLRYGKTPTAFRVVYARNAWLAVVSMTMVTVMDLFLSLDRDLRFFVQVSTAMRQGCTFCADLVQAEAMKRKLGPERFRDLLDYATSKAFTPREKAALAYAEAVHASPHVSDAVLAALRAHFDDRAIVEIVWVVAVERFFNSMALPLRIGSDELAGRP